MLYDHFKSFIDRSEVFDFMKKGLTLEEMIKEIDKKE